MERKSLDDSRSELTIDELNQQQNQKAQEEKKNQLVSVYYSSSKNRSKKKDANTEAPKDVAIKPDMFSDYEGYRFPANLNNPWAVSKVLIQTRGKLSLKDLKSSSKNASAKLTAQAKEAFFTQRVLELEDEERRNQLKWQVKLGENMIDAETREDILRSRAQAEYEYRLSIGVPFLEQEVQRKRTIEVEGRTYRDFNKVNFFIMYKKNQDLKF